MDSFGLVSVMTSQIISVLNWNNTDRYNTFKMMFGGCRLLSLFTGLCESLQRRRRGQSWSNYSLFVLISQFNEMKRHPLVLKLCFLASAMLVFWRQK